MYFFRGDFLWKTELTLFWIGSTNHGKTAGPGDTIKGHDLPAQRSPAEAMLTLLPSNCCSPVRLHLLLTVLFFLTLLSPGKVVADYLGPQFRKLLGRSDKTLESVLQIHKPNKMTTGEDSRENIPSPLAECWMASHSALSLLCSLGCLGEAQWPISRQVDWKGLDSISIYHYIYSVGQKQMDRDLSTGFSAEGASWGTLSCRFASWRNWQISIIISTALIMGEV